jgi:ArsR family transcriptional regulator, arsenate/arsenite/antimonite-responsive transcriptional repressor
MLLLGFVNPLQYILTNLNVSMYYHYMAIAKAKQTLDVDSGELETAAWVFKALADPARLKILAFLSKQEGGKCCGTEEGICACDLESVIDLSQPTVSHHNLVLGEKRGRWMFYRIDPKGFMFIELVIKEFEKGTGFGV